MRRRYRALARKVKMHRVYTIREVSQLLDIHPNTLRGWRVRGLQIVAEQKPFLIEGHALKNFLFSQEKEAKTKLGQHELYCLSCRSGKQAAGGMADYEAVTEDRGNLIALCECCNRPICRIISVSDLPFWQAKLDVHIRQAPERIST